MGKHGLLRGAIAFPLPARRLPAIAIAVLGGVGLLLLYLALVRGL